MGWRVVITGLFLSGAAVLSAQEYGKREVFGVAGIGKAWDDEGSLGRGFNGGGGFGYRLTRRFGVEAEVNGFHTERKFEYQPTPFQAGGVMVLGNGLLHVNGGHGQFYLIGGAGLLHIRTKVGFDGLPVNRSANGLMVDAGAGIKIFVSRRIVVRPEVRLYGGNSGAAVEAPFTNVRVSVALGYCW